MFRSYQDCGHRWLLAPDEPVLQLLNAGPQLVRVGLRHSRSTADAAQLRVDLRVRGAGARRPRRNVLGQLTAQVHQLAVVGNRSRFGGPALDLLALLFAQQRRDLFGLQQPGDPQEAELLIAADVRAGAELAAIKEHAVE